jgi:repressor LexA
MKEITERQADVLSFIKKYIDLNCRAPSQREIGASFKFSSAAARDHLLALAKKGYIKMGSKGRAIVILRRVEASETATTTGGTR